MVAAQGKFSITFAAFMSNVALAIMRETVKDLLQNNDGLVLEDWLNGNSPDPGIIEKASVNPTALSKVDHMMGRLKGHFEMITDYEERDLLDRDHSCPRCTMSAAKDAQLNLLKTKISENFFSAILDNVVHTMTSEILPDDIVRSSTLLFAEIGHTLLTDKKNDIHCWMAVLQAEVVTQGYRLYLRNIPKSQPGAKPRLDALRLAQKVHSDVDTVLKNKSCFSCRCPGTLGSHLHHLRDSLVDYTCHNCWGLFFQSPLVAGGHILEILDRCHHYGLHLLKFKHFVGAVLHTYNVLRQTAGLEAIQILDMLCLTLSTHIFAGPVPPKMNFDATWARYMGARLKFDQVHGKNNHDNWCLSIPAHADRAASGVDVPSHYKQGTNGSWLFMIKNQKYHVSQAQVDDLAKHEDLVTPTRKDLLKDATPDKFKLAHCAFSSYAQLSKRPKDQDRISIARLNMFALFGKCLQVITQVSNEMHESMGIEDGEEENCICFTYELLLGADRIVDARRLGQYGAWQKHERETIEQAKKALQDVFGGLTEEDLTFDV
jgi:hypothetical protein